jgi:hypothetical protein
LQYIAVKAETADEAYHQVETILQDMLGGEYGNGTWYDWFVVGGGRWNTGNSDDIHEAYKEGKTNMIVSTDNLDEFLAILESCIESRVSEFQRYRDEWQRANINLESYFDMYDGDMDYSMKLYPLGKMIDMVQGEWDYNSYFYDLEHWSTNPIHMTKDRLDVGGVWYLVPVDFHY